MEGVRGVKFINNYLEKVETLLMSVKPWISCRFDQLSTFRNLNCRKGFQLYVPQGWYHCYNLSFSSNQHLK